MIPQSLPGGIPVPSEVCHNLEFGCRGTTHLMQRILIYLGFIATEGMMTPILRRILEADTAVLSADGGKLLTMDDADGSHRRYRGMMMMMLRRMEDEDEEEEEEHPASADSVPPPVHRVTARMSIEKQVFLRLLCRLRRDCVLLWVRDMRSVRVYLLPLLDLLEILEQTIYVGYGITDTWDNMVEDIQGTLAATDVAGLSQRMIIFFTTIRQDTDKIYVRLDDVQDDRLLMSGRLNMLYRDRRAHARTALLMEREARLSREAWGRSMDASDTSRFKVRALRTIVLAQQTEIAALRVTALQGQQGPVSGPAQQEIPEEAGSGEKKPYGGSKPLCPKCNYHHDGPCAPKCHKCNRVGHLARDCRSPANTNASNNQRGTEAGQKPTCYECGAQGHFKRDCPKLKNNNRGNQGGNGNAPAKVYAVGRAGTNPDSNVVTGTFLLNNRYASVLFDTGADRSFVSTAFSSQIDITPSTLDHYYDVELADGRIIGLNAIIRGCTLNFLNHPFNIDLMPVELGSLDVIIGRDWLEKYQSVIVCAEKIVRIP
ncbi:putative reverse transcriptase domain-containing protein [Tanacetum coccineum]